MQEKEVEIEMIHASVDEDQEQIEEEKDAGKLTEQQLSEDAPQQDEEEDQDEDEEEGDNEEGDGEEQDE